jgi:hypothetical protein
MVFDDMSPLHRTPESLRHFSHNRRLTTKRDVLVRINLKIVDSDMAVVPKDREVHPVYSLLHLVDER